MTGTKNTNYDAIFCGKQPLHNTNLIQPHGVLIVLDKALLIVVQTSENVAELTGLTREEIVGRSIKDIITEESFDAIQSVNSATKFKTKIPQNLTFTIDGVAKAYMALIHEKDDLLLIEVEFADEIEKKGSFINVFEQLKQVISAFDNATTVNETCHIAANEIKRISGFDKVMIYSFDEAWNGTVIAEAREKAMDSYLGLKFPASDIPKQARDLYFKNPFRLIPNRDYEPVPLSPFVNPVTNTATNLSDCKLRSVAPVHIEYLKNMGIVASMSTRIIHQENLWGLISCHHLQAKYLSFEETSFFELISNVLSSKIGSVLNKISNDRTDELNSYLINIIEQVALFDDIVNMFAYNKETLLRLLSAEGLAICWNGTIEMFGLTPEESDILDLQQWLLSKKITQMLHLPALSFAFGKADTYVQIASGLVALPIDPEAGNYLLAFRPEAIQQVKWGGNPNETITFEKNSTRYHPRNSFETWKETVKKNSVPWTTDELATAQKFRNFLVEYSLKRKNKELEVAIEEFTFMANLMPQLLWTAKADGSVDFFNEQWYSFTGQSKQQSLEGWIENLHPEDYQKTLARWQESVMQKKNYEIEYRLRRNDGTYTWFLGRALPLLDNNKNVIKWFGTCTNIDEQKKMEQTLEQNVKKRTEELTALNNELEKSNNELQQYAFIASHDLQEPVRKIQVFSKILKEKYLSEDHDKAEVYINKIIASSHRIRSLIIDLLSYSSIAEQNLWQQTDLTVVVENVLQNLELLIDEKKAEIIISNLPAIKARKGQMEQVFQNLISNALYYTSPDRPPVIQISSRYLSSADFDAQEVDNGPFVEIIIMDNGLGFDKKYSEKIFQIFQRLLPRNETGGTGIGLSIVKKIIDNHRGIIKANGIVNEGAYFNFILPVNQT
ncbi:PAS domain-containing protein [Segetibacter koreensis]|uniref:PAS domain-containing protein n=1 Tax=Segetibacter koreensis TaxID=398037 RepID=UPI00036254C4|nr:PAS domain-containing protein [Segetibacter koreensis]